MNDRKEFFYLYDSENIYVKIFYSDIYYIETLKSTHYCILFYKFGNIKKRISITDLLEKLPNYFFRCSSSTIVNSLKIEKIDCFSLILYLEDKHICRYSPNYKNIIKKILECEL